MVECRINGVACQMLIDNGVLWDELMFFGGGAIDSLGLEPIEAIEVGGAGSGNPIMADTAEGITVEFPGIEFTDQPAIAVRKDAGMADWWPGVEGQVCGIFFKHFITEIDFDNSLIILHKPETFDYKGEGAAVPLMPLPDGSWMIPAQIKVERGTELVKGNVILDLGQGNPISVYTGEKTGIALPESAEEKILGHGVQGAIKGHMGRIEYIEIAGYRLCEVPSGFEPSVGRIDNWQMGMIGMRLFERFNVIFDYRGGRLILEPSRRFGERFAQD
jgi:hypothetical protein